jgi:hypothetical protein
MKLISQSRSSSHSFILVLAALAFTMNAYSQKFDLKKDVIIKDKVPYAKLSGEAGFLKPAHLTILSLNGDSLVRIKAWTYPNANPRGKILNGFKIDFIKSGKSLIRPSLFSTKNKIIDFFFAGFSPDLIVNNAVNPTAEDAYISQFDKSNEVALTQADEKAESEYLKKILPLVKDTTQAITVRLIKETKNPDGSITQDTEVSVGGRYLMSMRKQWTSEWVMSFYRNVTEKVSIRDTEVGFVNIATLVIPSIALSSGIGTSDLFTVQDGKSQEIKIHSPKEAEKEVTLFLIRKKYL